MFVIGIDPHKRSHTAAVLDVPPRLARVRLLDAGRTDKTDPHHARSAAIVALRHAGLRPVTPVDRTAVLRLLADRHRNLVAQPTRVICRLHALLSLAIAGGLPRQLNADRALKAPVRVQVGCDAGRVGRHVGARRRTGCEEAGVVLWPTPTQRKMVPEMRRGRGRAGARVTPRIADRKVAAAAGRSMLSKPRPPPSSAPWLRVRPDPAQLLQEAPVA